MRIDCPTRGVTSLCYLGVSACLRRHALPLFVPFDPCEESPSCQPLTPLECAAASRASNKIHDLPNLIDIQRRSFEWLTDPENGGLRETIDDISPIEDYTGNLAVDFGEFTFDEPVATIEECREKDLTYARPLTVTVAFVNRETGEIREQSVFMGDFPWMTERGTFIINGTERVVVTQLVRSPGAYLMEAKDREKQVFVANLMPARGSWLELEIDKKGRVYVRIDRKRKLPVTVLLRAMGYASDEEILNLFDNSLYIRNTIDADPEVTRTEEGALIELFKKQRPGEPPSVDNARALLHQLFFDPKRYDLTRVGRYKLNSRLRLDIDLETRTLTHDDIIALVKELVSPAARPRHARGAGGRDQGLRRRGAWPTRASTSPITSTSTSTSATAACGPSASSSRRPSASASTGWSASCASASPPRTPTRSRRRRSSTSARSSPRRRSSSAPRSSRSSWTRRTRSPA